MTKSAKCINPARQTLLSVQALAEADLSAGVLAARSEVRGIAWLLRAASGTILGQGREGVSKTSVVSVMREHIKDHLLVMDVSVRKSGLASACPQLLGGVAPAAMEEFGEWTFASVVRERGSAQGLYLSLGGYEAPQVYLRRYEQMLATPGSDLVPDREKALLVVSDGSLTQPSRSTSGGGGFGWLNADGGSGMAALDTPESPFTAIGANGWTINATEVAGALTACMESTEALGGRRMVLALDNRAAVQYLKSAQRLGEWDARWKGPKLPEEFVEHFLKARPQVLWLPKAVGHPLHQGADALAWFAQRSRFGFSPIVPWNEEGFINALPAYRALGG